MEQSSHREINQSVQRINQQNDPDNQSFQRCNPLHVTTGNKTTHSAAPAPVGMECWSTGVAVEFTSPTFPPKYSCGSNGSEPVSATRQQGGTHPSQTVWTDHHAAQSNSNTVVPFADSPGTSYLNSAASVVTVERDAAGDDSAGLAVTRAAAVDADADDDDVIGDAGDDWDEVSWGADVPTDWLLLRGAFEAVTSACRRCVHDPVQTTQLTLCDIVTATAVKYMDA